MQEDEEENEGDNDLLNSECLVKEKGFIDR